MIHLNAGNTWDHALLDGIQRLHDTYPSQVRVTELYGSARGDPLTSARPDFRLPDKSESELERFVAAAHSAGLEINYTVNAPCLGGIEDIERRSQGMRHRLRYLGSIGVNRMTATHPLIMEMIAQETSVPIEVSTICGVHRLSQIHSFAGMFPVDKICLDIYCNRDIVLLRQCQQLAASLNTEIELIANEFCSTGGAPCVYRTSCYNLHGHGGNPGKLFDDYPMNRCIKSRTHPGSWLKAMVIMPEDVCRYVQRTGIQRFKVTGRTHPTPALLAILEYYVSQRSPQNLLDLWIPLQNIGRTYRNYITRQTCYISTEALHRLRFTDRWIDGTSECPDQCYATENRCTYCDTIWKRISSEVPSQ